MGLFRKKKTKEEKTQPAEKSKAEVKPAKKQDKKSEIRSQKSDNKAKKSEIKGTSTQAYDVLLKPLITEKASELGALNKYAFAIDPAMNKIEVKKAIRKLYEVDPVDVNILNFSGKKVRYGKVSGRTKKWKKAIVTLKEGDTIQVYEGV